MSSLLCKSFVLANENVIADIVIEDSAFEGVKEIGGTVSEDLRLVTDKLPKIVSSFGEADTKNAVLVGTLGKSKCLDVLFEEGVLDRKTIEGKREVFLMAVVDLAKENEKSQGLKEKLGPAGDCLEKLLVIAGSDKRGTIYGMFHLSELCGVSPLVYFGDAMPEKKDILDVTLADFPVYVSKEPSVFYRGFFINDEWPAFGNWATDTFGGVNAKCYRKVFELLLRLKGNYMWPAMWNSNFSEEGPGIESAKLADTLGVVMGTSHHEPLFRAGNEWQQQYRNYGEDNTWSFMTNGDAITKFWEDGVDRNKEFESVITIGMRGEADSKLLPEDATMKDNIEVVKKAILAQDKILREKISEDFTLVPRMLAIYKEVEDYYYGDETCEGLKDWDELEDAIFLLSDDNHGNLRNLPTESERNHRGGYGMYYHFDYHGAPISYEWTNCNRLTKTWEQMSLAYEAGVTKMWIVNVGDLKEMEYPLSFFMDLAYDFDNWGKNGLNRTKEYVFSWIDKQFGNRLSAFQKDEMFTVLEGYTRFNALRTPETMNDMIYHPVHYRESEKILKEVREILAIADKLHSELSGETLLTYESMIYYAAAASLNMIIAWILTGFNHNLAAKGSVYANSFIDEIEKRIALDQQLVEEFHAIANGKWNHCLSSAHTGFRSWDDREWSYPVVQKVAPLSVGKVMISFRGQDRYHLGAYWQDMAPLVNKDFCRPETEEVLLDIDSRGKVGFSYEVKLDSQVLHVKNSKGSFRPEKLLTCDAAAVDGNDECCHGEFGRNTVTFTINKQAIEPEKEYTVKGRVDVTFDNGQRTYVDLEFTVMVSIIETADDTSKDLKGCKAPKNIVVDVNTQYCVFSADSFTDNKHTDEAGFEVVDFLGREGSAIKSFPAEKQFDRAEDAPFVSYEVNADENGEYDVRFYLMTRNPSFKGGRLKFFYSVNDSAPVTANSVSDHYYTEWQDEDWAQGVLRGGRNVEYRVSLQKGKNSLHIYAGDPGVIIEKIMVKKSDYKVMECYLF